MSRQNNQNQILKAASPALYDAYWDFILSRQAMICSDQTLEWYRTTLGMVLGWMVQHGIFRPEEITSRVVRNYLADMSSRGLSDSYIHNHARVIRTLLLFWHVEKYIADRVVFPMPRIAEKRMRFLTAPEVKKVIDACSTKRDKALVLVMVDSGVRRSELCALNWQDVDVASGLITILHGKGGKSRSVVVGVKTRRAILAYRRETDADHASPVFTTTEGLRLQPLGVRSLLKRLGDKAGLKVNPHALRRTFATLSLKAGMNPLHLQALLGHKTLEMTQRYIRMVDDDLIAAHGEHGPIDHMRCF